MVSILERVDRNPITKLSQAQPKKMQITFDSQMKIALSFKLLHCTLNSFFSTFAVLGSKSVQEVRTNSNRQISRSSSRGKSLKCLFGFVVACAGLALYTHCMPTKMNNNGKTIERKGGLMVNALHSGSSIST